jgi:hypothetical protein
VRKDVEVDSVLLENAIAHGINVEAIGRAKYRVAFVDGRNRTLSTFELKELLERTRIWREQIARNIF